MNLGFSAITAGLVDPREAFALASELGLDLELSVDLHEMFPELPGARELREMGRAAGVGFTVHLPFVDLNLASLVEAAWATSLERMQRALEFSEAVGAQVGVLHTGQVPLRHPVVLEAAWERLAQALERLSPPPVPVAVENLALDHHDLLQEPAELVRLVEGVGEGFGYTLDLPHAYVQGGAEQIRAYLKAMQGSRAPLLHLHLHDNQGDYDTHLPVGAGNLPYPDFKDELSGFEGTAAFEVTGGAQGVRTSLQALRRYWDI